MGPYKVERRDATDRAGWGGVDATPCFVVALEVLDNLPHDRLCWSAAGGGGGGGEWRQTRVIGGGGGGGGGRGGTGGLRAAFGDGGDPLHETTEALSDPLLARTAAAIDLRPAGIWASAVRAFEAVMGQDEAVFVPTGCMAGPHLADVARHGIDTRPEPSCVELQSIL